MYGLCSHFKNGTCQHPRYYEAERPLRFGEFELCEEFNDTRNKEE